MRIALLQCELEHRHQAPHLAMCLFADDLRRDGHDVRCALVHPSALDAAAGALAGDRDLLVLDSIFPFALVSRLREAVGATTLVGGHNALQHALRGPGDLAIVGPGRAAIRQVAMALGDGRSPLEFAGVWARDADGVLDCGPDPGPPDPSAELLPFEPDLDWGYFGPPRAPGSNLRAPSVVAAFGCPWNRSALGDGGPFEGVTPRLPDVPMSQRAAARMEARFVRREGGCTFCVLRYTLPVAGRAARLAPVVEQARVLLARGARGLSLQTEDPLPLLGPLLDGLDAAGLAGDLDELHVRTIPWLLLRHEGPLRAAIGRAEELGVRLVLAQVGFEAFDEAALAVFHKGLTVGENRRAARLLGELTSAHEGFAGTGGHGVVPLHPWATPAALRETIAACRQDAPWLLPSISPAARIELYDEWSPLFWKLQDDDLLAPAPDRFGWDWRYSDDGMGEVAAVAGALLAEGVGDGATRGADVLDAVAAVHEREPDPQARRAAYLALRGRLRRAGS